jgi:hypothetical protein
LVVALEEVLQQVSLLEAALLEGHCLPLLGVLLGVLLQVVLQLVLLVVLLQVVLLHHLVDMVQGADIVVGLV